MQKIKVWTDNWGPEKIEVKELLWCKVERVGYKSNTTVVFSLDALNCTAQEARNFFRKVAQHCVENPRDNESIHHQFKAVLLHPIPNGAELVEDFFVKWFWIEVLDKHLMISHDIAFDTVLVKKRKFYEESSKFEDYQTLPLGGFFRKRWKRAKHAQAKQQRQAYKSMGNLIV